MEMGDKINDDSTYIVSSSSAAGILDPTEVHLHICSPSPEYKAARFLVASRRCCAASDG